MNVEASYYGVQEYMFYVNNYYNKLALNGFKGNKVVFIASDD